MACLPCISRVTAGVCSDCRLAVTKSAASSSLVFARFASRSNRVTWSGSTTSLRNACKSRLTAFFPELYGSRKGSCPVRANPRAPASTSIRWRSVSSRVADTSWAWATQSASFAACSAMRHESRPRRPVRSTAPATPAFTSIRNRASVFGSSTAWRSRSTIKLVQPVAIETNAFNRLTRSASEREVMRRPS